MSPYRTHQKTGSALSGFTLFELLVVILIISLLSALALPRLAASLPGVQLKSTARAVAASLRYARSRAVYESTPYIAIFDNTQKRLVVESIEIPLYAAKLDHIREILNRSELQKSYQFPDGIEFGVLNTNDAVDDPEEFAIYFFPRGDSTGAKIVLHNLRRQNYTITVDMITGSVEIDR